MNETFIEVDKKIQQNASQGHKTLLLFFFAGHAAIEGIQTYALLNSMTRGDIEGGNQFNLERTLHR